MLHVAERDADTVFIYGDKQDVYNGMHTFEDSLVMTYSYNNQPALIVRKEKKHKNKNKYKKVN